MVVEIANRVYERARHLHAHVASTSAGLQDWTGRCSAVPLHRQLAIRSSNTLLTLDFVFTLATTHYKQSASLWLRKPQPKPIAGQARRQLSRPVGGPRKHDRHGRPAGPRAARGGLRDHQEPEGGRPSRASQIASQPETCNHTFARISVVHWGFPERPRRPALPFAGTRVQTA